MVLFHFCITKIKYYTSMKFATVTGFLKRTKDDGFSPTLVSQPQTMVVLNFRLPSAGRQDCVLQNYWTLITTTVEVSFLEGQISGQWVVSSFSWRQQMERSRRSKTIGRSWPMQTV